MLTFLLIASCKDHRPLSGAFFCCVHCLLFVATNFDFQIITTDVPGISLVMSMNEDAFSYITEECEFATLPNGAAPLADTKVPHFLETSERCHFSSSFV